jgi:cell division protease FtsH
VAGEAGVPFFAASGSDFVEVFVGQGAARVRELFDRAAKCEEGAVVFVDEIDALGRRRASGPGGNDEREQTLNQLLVSMDGFGTSSRVVVVAATNRLDLLDEALTRPGRFDRHVRVDLPSERGRLAILRVHAAGKPLSDETSLERLARLSMGCSGAMLKTILNEAAIMAARAGRETIEEPDLVEGQLRALAGPERRDAAHAEDELEIVAFHEAGHGLAAELCPTHDRAERITIKPRGQAGGLALYGQTDRMLMRPQALHEKLVVLLAGRAAEEIAFGSISSGAANDLQRATALARQAVEQLGFAASVGQLVADPHSPLGDETRREIDREVRSLIDLAYDDALRLLRAHRRELDRLANGLLSDRELDRAAIAALVGDVAGAPREAPRDAARPARRLRPVPATPEPQVVVALENRRSASRRAARLRDRVALAIETVLGADSERARKAS